MGVWQNMTLAFGTCHRTQIVLRRSRVEDHISTYPSNGANKSKHDQETPTLNPQDMTVYSENTALIWWREQNIAQPLDTTKTRRSNSVIAL